MKSIISILLAIVFFISSTGFTMVSHICGGKIHKQSINFVAEDLKCGMENSEEKPCEDNTIKDDCCRNEFQNFKITDEFQTSTYDVKLNVQFFVAFVSSYIKLFTIENNNYSKYLNYHPPLPDKDISVLIQSFLI